MQRGGALLATLPTSSTLPGLTHQVGPVPDIDGKTEGTLGQRLDQCVRQAQAEVGDRRPQMLLHESPQSRLVVDQ